MILSKEYLDLQQEIRNFVNSEIVPYAKHHDSAETLHPHVICKMKESKFLGAMIPVEYGGLGMNQISIGILNEEVGRGCSSVRSMLTVQGMVALAIWRWGSLEQKERWLYKLTSGEILGAFALTEPNVGSDANNIHTSATLEGDTYEITGEKKWTTLGQIADIFLVFAQVNGKLTAFIVERNTPGLQIKPINGLLGVRASMIAEINLDHCKVPKEHMIGSTGFGLSHVGLTCLDYGRYTVAMGCVGLGQACLEESVRYARKRKQFGKRLRENQLIQKMITEMTVNIKAARLLCYNAAELKEKGEPEGIMETWAAKYFVSRSIVQIASDAVQIHGANGLVEGAPVERFYRDAKINEIIEGTTQIHEMLIASNTFRII